MPRLIIKRTDLDPIKALVLEGSADPDVRVTLPATIPSAAGALPVLYVTAWPDVGEDEEIACADCASDDPAMVLDVFWNLNTHGQSIKCAHCGVMIVEGNS